MSKALGQWDGNLLTDVDFLTGWFEVGMGHQVFT